MKVLEKVCLCPADDLGGWILNEWDVEACKKVGCNKIVPCDDCCYMIVK